MPVDEYIRKKPDRRHRMSESGFNDPSSNIKPTAFQSIQAAVSAKLSSPSSPKDTDKILLNLQSAGTTLKPTKEGRIAQ